MDLTETALFGHSLVKTECVEAVCILHKPFCAVHFIAIFKYDLYTSFINNLNQPEIQKDYISMGSMCDGGSSHAAMIMHLCN